MLVVVLVAVRPEPVREAVAVRPGEMGAIEELLVGRAVERRQHRGISIALARPDVVEGPVPVAPVEVGVELVGLVGLVGRAAGPKRLEELDDPSLPRLDMGDDVLARPFVIDPFEHRGVVEPGERVVKAVAAGFDQGSVRRAIHGAILDAGPVRGCQVTRSWIGRRHAPPSPGPKAIRTARASVSPGSSRRRPPGSPWWNRRMA